MDLWAWIVDNGKGGESLAALPTEPGKAPMMLVAAAREHLEVFTDVLQEHADILHREFRLRRYVPAGSPVTTVSPSRQTRDDHPLDPAADSDIPHLGELTFGEHLDRCLAAGLTVSSHDVLPAQRADDIAAAHRDGRLVARLRQREDSEPSAPGESGLVLRRVPPHAADVARRLVIAERRALSGDGDPALVTQLSMELMNALDVD